MKKLVTICAVVVMLCTSALTQAATLYVQDIILSIPPPTTFYTYSSGSGSLSLSNISVGPPVLILEGLTGNGGYTISSPTVTISSSLVQDTSSGGLASGNFQGGGTLTIAGTLKYNNVAITPAGTNLIVATMASQPWSLGELTGTPIILDSSIYFVPTAQGLGLGIANGSGDTLKINNFRADFTFMFVTPNPSVLNTDQSLAGMANSIQIVAAASEPSPCMFVLAGDLNDDCTVDFYDFAIMAANWLIDCDTNPSDPACAPK